MTWKLLLAVALAAVLPCGQFAFGKEQPNVIIVMTDDQGYGEFACNGNPIVQSPNIDHLAAESLRLTDFHVAPMCTPTRSQLMTGLDAFRTGAINVSSGRALLRPELTTIANVFKGGGYRTGIFGKWHLGDNYPFRPEDRRFDQTRTPDEGGRSVTFELSLTPGDVELQSWFLDAQGNEIVGAYYVYLARQ